MTSIPGTKRKERKKDPYFVTCILDLPPSLRKKIINAPEKQTHTHTHTHFRTWQVCY
jgi:hypothetical protein